MFSNHRNPRIRDTFSLAGWLFADLLLGLAMLFLVFNTKATYIPNTLTSTPSPTKTPSQTPSPKEERINKKSINKIISTHTPTPNKQVNTLPKITATANIGLELIPSHESVFVNAERVLKNDPKVLHSLRNQIIADFKKYEGRKVGLVITLGYHGNVGDGVRLAKIANNILIEEYPEVFNGAVTKPFWWINDTLHQTGTITFEFYFFSKINQQ